MGLARKATVITASDGVSAGVREDVSGSLLESVLTGAGFEVTRGLVPDESEEIAKAILAAAELSALVLTTGGTGFGPRDVTPEATESVLEREAPGLVHLMFAKGLESTPLAALSRSRAGTIGSTLVVNLPGSPQAAREGIDALMPVLEHLLRLLGGDTSHG